MDSKTLEILSRTETGKGAAKKARKEGLIPAVIYGHNAPVNVAINEREFNKKFHTVSENTIITLQGKDSSYDVLVKDYQDDILTEKIMHIDFFEIERGKALRTNVPVHTTGNSVGVKMGGILQLDLHDLEIECLPKDLPHEILIDITEVDLNDSIHVSDITPPEGVKILTPENATILNVAMAKEEPAETTEAAEGEAAAEGEEAAEAAAEESAEESSEE